MLESFDNLERLYGILERESGRFSLACRDRCPDCCTVNVTATSLETALIFHRLAPDEIRRMIGRLHRAFPENRYTPGTTVNGFARACMAGVDLPGEDNDPGWGACPLLCKGRCSIYRVRPLGCRVMVSETPCRKTGAAQMPPFALTLANILGQILEQMDAAGFTGNFSDVLAAYAGTWKTGGTPLYLALDNLGESDRKGIFLRNHPIPALMVPPEHRERAAPLIRELRYRPGDGSEDGNNEKQH
jgi:Fe-S-cluster containining protein